MAAVITVCREDLHLPVVDPIQVLLYKNTASFASFGQGWRTLPIDSDTFTAFTQRGEIHIDLQKTHGEKWATLIDLLAHEYGHAIQAGVSDRHMARWFNEGFASWVAARVLDSLGWQGYAIALERATLELSNNREQLTRLGDLDWHWEDLRTASRGNIKTYVLAFCCYCAPYRPRRSSRNDAIHHKRRF